MRVARSVVLARGRRVRWVWCAVAAILAGAACGGGETAVGGFDRGSGLSDRSEAPVMSANPRELSAATDAARILSGVLSVSAPGVSCGLRPEGTLECWGLDVSWRGPGGVFAAITGGIGYGCGLRLSGRVDCWGESNLYGKMDAPEGAFTAVSASVSRTCGLRPDGSAECWGGVRELLAGVEPLAPDVAFRGGAFTAISVGGAHVCGLRPDGEVACWGTNWFGQAEAPPGAFVAVDAGASHSCGLRPDGSIECWGEDSRDAGELSGFTAFQFGGDEEAYVADRRDLDGDSEDWVLIPSHLAFMDLQGAVPEAEVREEMARRAVGWEPPGGPFVAVSAGSGFTCGLRLDGEVACWGYFAREEPRIPLEVYAEVYGERLWDFHDTTKLQVSLGPRSRPFDPRFYPLYESLYGARVWELDPSEHLIFGPGLIAADAMVADLQLIDPPPGPFIAIEAGAWRACGLRPDGDLDCWGLLDEDNPPPPGPFATEPITANAHTEGSNDAPADTTDPDRLPGEDRLGRRR